jgi:hypothetical protein
MGIVCKGMDFRNEERAIRNQVQQGLRCADCLRPFNGGERKQFKAGSGSVICQKCCAEQNTGEIPEIVHAETHPEEGASQ